MNHLFRLTEHTLKFLRFFFLCLAPSAVFAIDDGTYYLDATYGVVDSVISGTPSGTTTVTVSGSMTVINVGGVPTIPNSDITMSANGQTVSMIPAAASANYFRFKTVTEGAGLIDRDYGAGGIQNIDGIWFSTSIVTPFGGIGYCADWDACGNVFYTGADDNANSISFSLEIQTPATEFEAKNEAIKAEIVSDVKANLQNVLNANVNLVKQAKVRFIASQSNAGDAMNFLPGRNSVPLNYDASLSADSARITSRGNFFAQQGSYDGKSRQVVFGDFSVVGEKDGSVTGTLSSRIARERHISDQTMMGYFLGVEISHTDIYSSFSGKNRGYGLIMGGYFVNELTDNMFVDGFVSVGTGNNILDMSNDVLSLEGIYQTRSGSIGGALTGVYDMGTYEFWPELSFAVGKTKTLKANFTGTAYGQVDDSLTLDTGDTTIAKLTARPEMRRDLEDEYMSSGYTSQLTMAPRLICEWVTTDRRTQDCGSGAEVGLMRRSYDGLSQFTATISRDYVGSSGRTGLEFKFEKRF